MKKPLSLLFILLAHFSFCQDFESYIAHNAITLPAEKKLDSSFYDTFSPYRLILLGEMHGTMEPSLLVIELAKLFSSYGETVSIGLEIPHKKMELFIQNPTDSSLFNSTFFQEQNTDGRNSFAWYQLIQSVYSNPNVHLFFFDNPIGTTATERDSMMYDGILRQQQLYPNDRIITLTGNLHNQLLATPNQKTMGSFCYNDRLHFKPNEILNLNHWYAEGTLLNNTGNGLVLQTIEFEESALTRGTSSQNYFVFYQTAGISATICIYFTRTVHHSKSLK